MMKERERYAPGRLRSVAARSPLPVIWSGLVVKLLRYRMTGEVNRRRSGVG
jgi:hypothetical protein